MAQQPHQLNELPILSLGDVITVENGAQYAITSIVSSIIEDDDGNYPILIFECSASLLKSTGGN